jgi:hypothetical protein
MITKKCKICGTEFQTKNEKGIYYSSKCKSKAFRKNEKKKINNFLKSKKDNLINEQSLDIQHLKRIVQEKNLFINDFQIEYKKLYNNYLTTISNHTDERYKLDTENEQLQLQNKELNAKNIRYRKKIIELQNKLK